MTIAIDKEFDEHVRKAIVAFFAQTDFSANPDEIAPKVSGALRFASQYHRSLQVIGEGASRRRELNKIAGRADKLAAALRGLDATSVTDAIAAGRASASNIPPDPTGVEPTALPIPSRMLRFQAHLDLLSDLDALATGYRELAKKVPVKAIGNSNRADSIACVVESLVAIWRRATGLTPTLSDNHGGVLSFCLDLIPLVIPLSKSAIRHALSEELERLASLGSINRTRRSPRAKTN